MKTPARNKSQSAITSQPTGRIYNFGKQKTQLTDLDHCYDETVVNADVYTNSCQEIVLSALEGINGTIFMYGQTGAGKTYTMLGDYSVDINASS